jgi:hypothetical protein
MTMHEMLLAAQLMSEERVGKLIRENERETAARERAAKARLLGKVKA